MGLSLNSDEVQKNLALLPVADNVSFVFIVVTHVSLLHVWRYMVTPLNCIITVLLQN